MWFSQKGTWKRGKWLIQKPNNYCFCITAFPRGCTHYDGEHSLECLIRMWLEYGCIEEGENFPQKLKPSAFDQISGLNLM